SLGRERTISKGAERDRAVIALQHDRPFGLLVLPRAGPRRAGDFPVLVDDLAVVGDLHEPRRGGLLSGGVEPRRAEDDVEGLPLARRLGGVDLRRMAFVAFLPLAARGVPPLVDAAA